MNESWASSETARLTMRANRRRDTRPELLVRRILHARGLRYRVDVAVTDDRRKRADIVFTRTRIAVYIDGCFWHGCPEHFIPPKTNQSYWEPKIEGNIERDIKTSEEFRSRGWLVLRFWEHEDPAAVAECIIEHWSLRRGSQGEP
ncbi:very short patch repair endonuclease [Nocardia zapadnayensis]|nr:very short patch repair endonuclease [Nocardia zapadnayensis]MCX0278261.1 very short patch repair endonuclease [Nocardia zapadnayensis]